MTGEPSRVVAIIANPASGAAGAFDADAVVAALAAHGVPAHVARLRRRDSIAEVVERCVRQGATVVVAAGGDGTVGAVAAQLAGTSTVLGVLPVGTLNHFARDLGLPLELEAALQVIAHGTAVGVDVAEVNGRTFVNNSSIGLYPRIVLDRDRQRRRFGRGKWWALLRACLRVLRRHPVLHVDVQAGGRRLALRSAFVFVGNNRYHVEGFDIGERASLRGGELSLYLARDGGRWNLVRLALLALLGRVRQDQDFEALDAPECVVTTRRRRLPVAADGEVAMMEAPLRYRTRPGALRVLVPADRAAGLAASGGRAQDAPPCASTV